MQARFNAQLALPYNFAELARRRAARADAARGSRGNARRAGDDHDDDDDDSLDDPHGIEMARTGRGGSGGGGPPEDGLVGTGGAAPSSSGAGPIQQLWVKMASVFDKSAASGGYGRLATVAEEDVEAAAPAPAAAVSTGVRR